MHELTLAIARLATSCDGIVTIEQLRDLGARDCHVQAMSRSGFLHRRRRGVFAVGHCAFSREARWRAALAAAGEGAVLAGRAAARLWRLVDSDDERVDVIVPSQRRAIEGVHLHVTTLAGPDRAQRSGLAVTSVGRTLYDLARTGMADSELTFVFHEAAYQEVLDLREVDDVLRRHHGRRGVATLRRATAEHRAGRRGTRSGGERRVVRYLGACGAPPPQTGVPMHVGGETFEVDLWWPDHRLVVEVDGPGHDRPAIRLQDERRARLLAAAGIALIRVDLVAFDASPAAAVAPVLDALRRRP